MLKLVTFGSVYSTMSTNTSYYWYKESVVELVKNNDDHSVFLGLTTTCVFRSLPGIANPKKAISC